MDPIGDCTEPFVSRVDLIGWAGFFGLKKGGRGRDPDVKEWVGGSVSGSGASWWERVDFLRTYSISGKSLAP